MMTKHSMERCRVCDNYLRGAETCKYCQFEWAVDYPPTSDGEWDILDLDDNIEWSHLQIIDRLYAKGIECLSADIWYENNLAYIIGAKASRERVAEVLGVHDEVVYEQPELCLMILNLFQEKYLRGDLDGM